MPALKLAFDYLGNAGGDTATPGGRSASALAEGRDGFLVIAT